MIHKGRTSWMKYILRDVSPLFFIGIFRQRNGDTHIHNERNLYLDDAETLSPHLMQPKGVSLVLSWLCTSAQPLFHSLSLAPAILYPKNAAPLSREPISDQGRICMNDASVFQLRRSPKKLDFGSMYVIASAVFNVGCKYVDDKCRIPSQPMADSMQLYHMWVKPSFILSLFA
jgi:hypothetical protein